MATTLAILATVFAREFIFGRKRRNLSIQVPQGSSQSSLALDSFDSLFSSWHAECDPNWNGAKKLPQLALRDAQAPNQINMFDPCSGALLGQGSVSAMSAADVKAAVSRARQAQVCTGTFRGG